jgi:PKD repeat protein
MPDRVRPITFALSIALVGSLLFSFSARGDAPYAKPSDSGRVVGVFLMSGRITTAVRVRGERPGQTITRRWVFVGQSCSYRYCKLLSLQRERSDHKVSTISLHRTPNGSYQGKGLFYASLGCLGKTYPRGEAVPYRVTVRVTRAVTIQGISFAQSLAATYSNSARTDRTACPVGSSHDAAGYTGSASPLPSPPNAGFSIATKLASDSAVFRDTSVLGAVGAALVSREWNFGDPASGSADSSTSAIPSHHFTAPGIYGVSLAVIDANGLKSTATESVTAPGPPTDAFTAAEQGSSTTYAFTDTSTSGVGGAPLVGWSWTFGDPNSSDDTSDGENPLHTYTTSGTYTVTLTVTDANGRTSTVSNAIVVPASATASQSANRMVASTDESSPMSFSGRFRTG